MSNRKKLKRQDQQTSAVSPAKKRPSLMWARITAIAVIALIGWIGWLNTHPHQTSAEPTRTPSDLKPPFSIVFGDGRTANEFHLMGYEPLITTFTAPTGEIIQLTDDSFFTQVQEMISLLNGPYRDELNGFLGQTVLAGNDPNRNFFWMVAGPDYPGITDHPKSGAAAASFNVANHDRFRELWVDGEALAAWKYLGPEDKLFTATSLLHETRHINDYFNHPDIHKRRDAGWEAIAQARPSWLRTQTESKKVASLFENGLSAQVLEEMLAYNDQFTWIKDNSPALAKQVDERPTPEVQLIWLTWKAGNSLQFAQAVAEGYRSDLGQLDTPEDIWQTIKGDITKWAAEDYDKLQRSEHRPATK